MNGFEFSAADFRRRALNQAGGPVEQAWRDHGDHVLNLASVIEIESLKLKDAAVLVPIIDDGDEARLILTDPPYNTGNDSFVYPDNYSETLDEYQRRTGEKNEAGYLNKQSLWKKNSKESGQYHSAWLSMMYPRLYLARNLLRDDGVGYSGPT